MKRALLLMILFLVPLMFMSADQIDLGTFPVGKWLDTKYNAVWEFSLNNIRILMPTGGVYWDFAGKTIKNFKVSIEDGKPTLSFACDETGRTYTFSKALDLTNLNITMKITRPNIADYVIELVWQK